MVTVVHVRSMGGKCMSNGEFIELCDLLGHFITQNAMTPNYRKLSAEKKLAFTLYFSKDPGSVTMTVNPSGVHYSTVPKFVWR